MITNNNTLSANLTNLIFNNDLAGVFRTTLNGDYIEVNDSYLRIFGFETIDEIKNHKTIDFYPDPELRKQYINELVSKGKLENFMIKNIDRNGNPLFLLANVQIDPSDPNILDGVFFDLSKQMINELRLQEKNYEVIRLKSFLENISDAVQVVDREGAIVYLNNEAKKRLGINLSEDTAYNIFDFSGYFKTKEQFAHHFNELKVKKTLVVESVHKNVTDGSLIPVEVSIRHETINGEEYLIASSRDISQRKADEELIQLKTKNIRDLSDVINSSSIVSITSKDGIITSVNKLFEELTGFSKNELIGANNRIHSSGVHDDSFWRSMYTKISSGESWNGEVCNRKKSGELYWVRGVIHPMKEGDLVVGYMSVLQDITKEKEVEQKLLKHAEFQDLILDVSLNLINVEPNNINRAFNNALEKVGLFVGCDRAYIFKYDHEKETGSNTHEWCNIGITAQKDFLQDVPFSETTEWIEKHFKGESIDIQDVQGLSESSLKKILSDQEIKSVISIPLMNNDTCIGFIGFDSVLKKNVFTERDKNILQLFARLIVNINERNNFLLELNNAHELINEYNIKLEQKVIAETEKSNKLSQQINELDKFVMIGELTSGITHDLNTPLGAIKVAAVSARDMLEKLFKNVLETVSLDQLHYACSRATESNSSLFVGSLQMLKERAQFVEFLNIEYPEVKNAELLAQEMVKARIDITENEIIKNIIDSQNPIEFLNVIYHIQAVRTFVDTIMEAGDKADSVVKNLRYYLKEGTNQRSISVNLNTNIIEVIDVLNYLIKQMSISLTLNIDPNLNVTGFPEKLYQLWSNLIKNAIDATGINGAIEVYSGETDDLISISVKNTGDAIPIEIQAKIWDKFFTTKEKSGTGLGLCIVKRMAEEHNAKIELSSENNITIFTISFQKIGPKI